MTEGEITRLSDQATKELRWAYKRLEHPSLAVSGAGLNLIFMTHFQDVAKGHFIVRRLEREFSIELVKDEYQRLAEEEEIENRDFSPVGGF